MDAILKMASDAGMSPSQGEATTGGLLSLLKGKLEGGQFDEILKKIPGADSLVQKTEEGETSPKASSSGMGGMFGSAMSSLGGSGGGGAATSVTGLMASLGGQGIDPKMIQTFLPKFASLIKAKCGIDITDKLGLPSEDATEGTSDAGGIAGKLGGLASGFGF